MGRLSVVLVATAALGWSVAACEVGGGSVASGSGEVTLRAEQGVDLVTGAFVAKGNYTNSDLRATNNGDALGLLPGGDTPAKYRACNWFVTGGGIHQTFGSLQEVPAVLPEAGALSAALPKAKTGNGFVCETHAGGWARGWIKVADATSLTLVFLPLDLATP